MKRIIAAAVLAAMALVSALPASAQVYKDSGQVAPNLLCSAVTTLPVGCSATYGDTAFAYDAGATKTLTQVIAAPAAGAIRVPASFVYGYESATGGELEIESGTGSNCATNTAIVFSVYVPATTVVNVSVPPLIFPAKSAACYFVSAGTLAAGGWFGTYANF